LLETEPGLAVSVELHELRSLVPGVVLVGGAIGVPALRKDQDVFTEHERVGEDCYRLLQTSARL